MIAAQKLDTLVAILDLLWYTTVWQFAPLEGVSDFSFLKLLLFLERFSVERLTLFFMHPVLHTQYLQRFQ